VVEGEKAINIGLILFKLMETRMSFFVRYHSSNQGLNNEITQRATNLRSTLHNKVPFRISY
jgi:hypothetical protein